MNKKVLFLCTQNACRSQMAEGISNAILDGDVEAYSAGTKPFEVHPLAIRVLNEKNIDISGSRSKHISEFQDWHFDLVITVCDKAKEKCPFFPGHGKRIHLSLKDPASVQGTEEERLEAFRKVSEQIEKELIPLLKQELGL